MCLITVAIGVSQRFPIAVAANRDEFHSRPSSAADWWPDGPDIVGGRDLVAGGSWLAMDRRGRIAAITNRTPPPKIPAPESRGQLIAQYLRHAVDRTTFAAQAVSDGERYGPFNLLLIDGAELQVVSNCAERASVSRGIRSFASTGLTEPWPKLAIATRGVELAPGAPDPVTALFDLLAIRRAMNPPENLDRESLFLVGDEFGTRCSTVILVDSEDHATFIERRFDASAHSTGESRFDFAVAGGALASRPPSGSRIG